MNGLALEPVRWSRRRWLYTVAALVFVQTGFILFIGERIRPGPSRPAFSTTVHLVLDDGSRQHLDDLPGVSDPTLLALPSLRGFSGAAWMQFSTPDFRPPDWTNAPHWLPLDASSLGHAFEQFVATNQPPPIQLASKPLPPPRAEPNFPNEPLPQFSRLRIEGELMNRRLLKPLELRSWEYTDMLSNTTVQAVVDADGRTLSARLIGSSGYQKADAFALLTTTGARFQPRADADGGKGLSWGRLVFFWHTLPIPATNLSAAPP